MKLHETAAAHDALKAALLAEHASLADDQEALDDTLEGISEFPELIDWALRKLGEEEAMAKASKELADGYAGRSKAAKERAEKMRHHMLTAMELAGEKTMKRPGGTVSVRAGKAELILEDDANFPMEFTKITTSPDKVAIRKALESGEAIEGACLGNGALTLSIRK